MERTKLIRLKTDAGLYCPPVRCHESSHGSGQRMQSAALATVVSFARSRGRHCHRRQQQGIFFRRRRMTISDLPAPSLAPGQSYWTGKCFGVPAWKKEGWISFFPPTDCICNCNYGGADGPDLPMPGVCWHLRGCVVNSDSESNICGLKRNYNKIQHLHNFLYFTRFPLFCLGVVRPATEKCHRYR